MAKLNLSVAIGEYDRTHALIDGSVAIDGVDPVYMTLIPEEIFFRAFRAAEFDICELSLSSYAVKTAQGDCPYVAVPAFISRAFRHNAVYVRTDRVKKPADLKGRKVGVPEYQLTANVWARAFLDDDYGVKPADIHWIRGGIAQPGRRKSLSLSYPPVCASTTRRRARRFPHSSKPARSTAPSRRGSPLCSRRGTRISAGCFPTRLRWKKITSNARVFFRSCTSSASAAHWPSGILGCPSPCSRRLRRPSNWRSRSLRTPPQSSVTLPFVEEMLRDLRTFMGEDFWSYGVAPNRKVLDYFLGQHHAQGLSARRLLVRQAVSPGDLRDVQGVNKAGCSRCITARRVTELPAAQRSYRLKCDIAISQLANRAIMYA